MMNQIRHNEGKPKLTYALGNFNAMIKLADFNFETDLGVFPMTLENVLLELSRFLARKDTDQDSLVRAFIGTAQLLQLDLGGILPPATDEMTTLEYVLRCTQAWDEYCLVCERGAQKYQEGDYRAGQSLRHYLDSALRHLRAHLAGESLNDDGCHTLANAVWNLWMALDQPDWRDDRLPALNEGVEP